MLKRSRDEGDVRHREGDRSRWTSTTRAVHREASPQRAREDRDALVRGRLARREDHRDSEEILRSSKSKFKSKRSSPEVEEGYKKRWTYAEVTRGKSSGIDEHRVRRRPPSPPERERRVPREEEEEEWILVKSKKHKKPINSNSGSEASRIEGRQNCHKCARPGHSISKCPNDWFCYYCRRSGHISTACPKRVNGSASHSREKMEVQPLTSVESATQESVAGERRVVHASVIPTPLIADFERRFNGGIIVKAQTGQPSAQDVSELLSAALVSDPIPIWVIQEIGVNVFYAHCNDEKIAKETIRVKGLEGRDSQGLEFFVTFKWWSRDYGAMKAENYPPVWIRLYNLPFHCWVRSGFQNVIRPFGMLIDIDRQTLTLSARKFARLKIGVVKKADIPSKILVEFDNSIYEVTVIVEAQKCVSFTQLASIRRKSIKGGDSMPEEEDDCQRLDEGTRLGAGTMQEASLRPLDNEGQLNKSMQSPTPLKPAVNPQCTSTRDQQAWRKVPKSNNALHRVNRFEERKDVSTVQDGTVRGAFFGKKVFINEDKGLSTPGAVRVPEILKPQDSTGQELTKSMGLVNEPWMGFSKEDIELSVKNAVAALLHSKVVIKSGPGTVDNVQPNTTIPPKPVVDFVQVEDPTESDPIGKLNQITILSPSSGAISGKEIIGALEGIREDNIVSGAETEGEEREVRGSVGSTATRKFMEYQRKGKRQMLSSESQKSGPDDWHSIGNKLQEESTTGEGATEATKRMRFAEGE